MPLSTWSRVHLAALAERASFATTREPSPRARILTDGARTARAKIDARFSSNAGHVLRDLALDGLG